MVYCVVKGGLSMRSYLSGLLGNIDSRSRLGSSIESDRLPHALLIDGPRGSGKTTLALEISAALNCERKKDSSSSLPCRRCNNCRRVLENNFPDVKILKKQEDKATIGVSEIKLFRQDMYLSGTESDYKVYIIRDAEKMTVEAQNALLIVLEEPPKNVVIILLSNGSDKILTTIKSRAQYVNTLRFDDEELRDHLLQISHDAVRMAREDPVGLSTVIKSSDGCIGKALTLLDHKENSKNKEERDLVLSVIDSLGSKNSYAQLYSAITSLPQKRAELNDALENILCALRDMICYKKSSNVSLQFFIDEKDVSHRIAAIGHKRLLKIYDVIMRAHGDNFKNANITALLSNLAAQLKLA